MTTSNRPSQPLPPPPATLHFVGIGGIGMSGLARILKIWGYTITGSDAVESAQTAALRAMDIPVVIGHHDPALASHADMLVTSKRAAANAAVEIDAAVANGAKVIRRGDLLGMAAATRVGVAVAGSHGKSTTSAMISVALRTLGADPTFAVGAILAATGTNAEPGSGEHFVAEADEFDRSFLGLFPDIAVITSVAFDHPDIYADQAAYDQAFVDFAGNIRAGGTLIIASDDAGSARVRQHLPTRTDLTIQTFGQDDQADWWLTGDATARTLLDPDGGEHALKPKVPGTYNARNAVAAVAAIHAAGFSIADAIRGVEAFTGIGRRFEFKGDYRGVPIVDDYAHHPEEIAAVIAAAREHFAGKRLIVVHQPHTYSRTWALLQEFAASLDLADEVVLMDIYGVGEDNPHRLSSADLAARMRRNVILATTPTEAAGFVRELIGTEADAVVLTIGAGSVTQVGPLLVQSAT